MVRVNEPSLTSTLAQSLGKPPLRALESLLSNKLSEMSAMQGSHNQGAMSGMQPAITKPTDTVNGNAINDLLGIRNKIQEQIAHKKTSVFDIVKKLKSGGMQQGVIDILTQSKLTPAVIDFFLEQTNNDPKKARRLAAKFGFKSLS